MLILGKKWGQSKINNLRGQLNKLKEQSKPKESKRIK